MHKPHLLVVRHCPEVAGSVLPAVILVLLPKCPICIAAYIAMVTGVGISLPVTAHLRTLPVILCATSLIYFVARQIHQRLAAKASKRFRHIGVLNTGKRNGGSDGTRTRRLLRDRPTC
jgi:hypothetical protein